jgi:hypothetical protein
MEGAIGVTKISPELTTQWWKWALENPINDNALLDQTGANTNKDQNQDNFFLAGTIGDGPIHRKIEIGGSNNSKKLFFPVVCVECSELEFPFNVSDQLTQLETATHEFIDGVTHMHASIDGINYIQNAERVKSDQFTIHFPVDNIYRVVYNIVKESDARAYSDGFWLLVDPLTEGTHTLRFGGELITRDNFEFSTDVTYEITVS